MGAIIARLERHTKDADQAALAVELLREKEFREKSERRYYENIKLACEGWLNPSDVKHVHLHHTSARLDGTCEWITSNHLFQRWANPSFTALHDRLLTISGIHGCGKSVLASSIITNLEKGQHCTLFFHFSSLDEKRQKAQNCIRTFLWQLLQQSKSEESLEIVRRLQLNGPPSLLELWETFERVVSSSGTPTYCVIDGVDECVDFLDNMTLNTKRALDACLNLRILLLGRTHAIQASPVLPDYETIDMNSASLDQDIEAYIDAQCDMSRILSLPETRENVVYTLKSKSDGMFLWVKLMIDDLKRSSSISEVSKRLLNLPSGLENAYRHIVLNLSRKFDPFEISLARDVLVYTSIACRPLQFNEFRYVHALHCMSLERAVQPLQNYLPLQSPQRILDLVGGLVSITDGVLRLIHSSTKDFLTRPEDQWISTSDQAVSSYRIDVREAHHSFSWLCLDYLRIERMQVNDMQYGVLESMRASQVDYPLLQYATLYTFYHLNRLGQPSSVILDKVKDLLESTQSISWLKRFTYLVFEDLTLFSQIDEFFALEGLIVNTGLDRSFYATLEENIQEHLRECRDPSNELLGASLSLLGTEEASVLGEEHSDEDTGNTQSDSQLNSSSSCRSANDTFVTIGRLAKILRGRDSLSVTQQIEMWLRLSASLRKTHALIDPLKLLFQLILKKASAVPVYVLVAVGGFYVRLEKFKEAFEVYTAASKKVDHLDVRLKFWIYREMGYCLEQAGSDTEALEFYNKAYSSRTFPFPHGIGSPQTVSDLLWMISLNWDLSRYEEALRLCENLYLRGDLGLHLSIDTRLKLQLWRYKAYRGLRDHHNESLTRRYIEMILNQDCKNGGNGEDKPPRHWNSFGTAYFELGNPEKALEYLELGKEACEGSPEQHLSLLSLQHNSAYIYNELGQHHKAKELFENVYGERQKVLGLGDRSTRRTKSCLDDVLLRLHAEGESRNVADAESVETSLAIVPHR